MTTRLPGPDPWYYEVRKLDCGCSKPIAGRGRVKMGEEIFCFTHQIMAKVVEIEPATLAEQDALCTVEAQK